MVQSRYISDILDLLLDVDDSGLDARNQLPYITEEDFEYTGGGLFVGFTHSKEINNFRVRLPELILDQVKIISSEFPIEANATLFFKDGIIDYLDIWCYLGDYPKQELKHYTMTQCWQDGRTIFR